jgi:putative Mg2+ transporter-C (MgtC) family protein
MHEFVNLLVAAFCGGLVGLEREVRRKPAGLRTNMLIALGAALFTQASILLAEGGRGDPARIAAQIVTGIGFLGAGAILHHRHDTVIGLTTAATVWVVAALGILAGSGHGWLALFGTLLTLGILTLVDHLERRLAEEYDRRHLRLEIRSGEGVAEAVRREVRRHRVQLESIHVVPEAERKAKMSVIYESTPAVHARLLERLRGLGGVQQIDEEAD